MFKRINYFHEKNVWYFMGGALYLGGFGGQLIGVWRCIDWDAVFGRKRAFVDEWFNVLRKKVLQFRPRTGVALGMKNIVMSLGLFSVRFEYRMGRV